MDMYNVTVHILDFYLDGIGNYVISLSSEEAKGGFIVDFVI